MDAAPDPARPVHIAIVRFTSLGDVIHTIPVAAAIRRHLPDARITWLVEEREQIMLRDNPVVDDVVVVPLRQWRTGLGTASGWTTAAGEVRDMARRLREAKIEVAIDVQGWAHKTSPFVLMSRAPIRIGFDRKHARDFLSPMATNRHVTPPPAAMHVVDQNLALLRPLGIQATEAEFPLPKFPDAEARAENWRQARGLSQDRRLIVLLPSTRGERKRWPAERYRELGRRLLEDPRACLLILGGPGEEALLESVRNGLPADRAFVWAPGPIPDLAAMIGHTHLAIGNDTGPLHIAAARGVPSLGLFGPTRGARNGPYGQHCSYLQSPTGLIGDITVDDVVAAVRKRTQ